MQDAIEAITSAKKAEIEQFCLELIDRLSELESNCMFNSDSYKPLLEKRLKKLYEILGENHKTTIHQER